MNINRKCNPISRKFKILARGPLLLLGMSHFALHKMFAECMFSQGVIVFDYQASMFCICKNFTRCTFSWRVIVFDYQASMLCISKTFCKTYVVWMSHILLHRCVIVTCKMTVMLKKCNCWLGTRKDTAVCHLYDHCVCCGASNKRHDMCCVEYMKTVSVCTWCMVPYCNICI